MGNAGARLGLQIGFAVVGAYFGDATGFAIGGLIGGIVGSLLFPIEQPNQTAQGPRLDDLTLQTSTYGNAIPVTYGTVRIAGNVIWSTGLIEHVNVETQDVNSGKGGSTPTSTITTYTYSASFAISLANNQILGIKRIWADDKLWYDFTNPPVGTSFAYELFKGTEDQLPCSTIEADKGVGNVPAFRGQAYIVFKNLLLTQFGNRIPNFHFEVVGQGTEGIVAQFFNEGYNESGFRSFIAFDQETGLIWYTREASSRIFVMTPDLGLVKELTGPGICVPYRISYQPPYMYIKQPPVGPAGIGQVPQLKEMEPRMFVGSNVWGNLCFDGASAHAIDTRDYQVYANKDINGDGLFIIEPWGGGVVVDMRTIDVNDIGQESWQKTHWWGTNVNTSIYSWTIAPYPFPWGIGTFNGNEEYKDQIAPFFTQEVIASDHDMIYAYAITADDTVVALDENMVPVNSVRVATGFANSFDRIFWDKFERKLYVIASDWQTGLDSHLIKMSEDLTVEHWRTTRPDTKAWAMGDIHPNTGALYVISKDFGGTWRLHEVDKTTGAILSDYQVSPGIGATGTNQKVWMDFKIYPNSMFGLVSFSGGGIGGQPSLFNGIAKVPLTPGPTSAYPTLQAVVEDISVRTGLSLSDTDASQLASDIVKGYALASRMPARSAIEPLMRGYFFDAVETDGLARFVKRGGASVATIQFNESGVHLRNSEPPPTRERSRVEENELPWQVDVNYMDVESFYKVNVQYARRLVGQSKTTIPVNIAAVFTADEAKRIAEGLLYNAWTERQTAMMSLTKKYLHLDPTDVILFDTSEPLALLDDFDRPNESPASGWEVPSAEVGMEIVGGALFNPDPSSDPAFLMWPDEFADDHEVEVEINTLVKDSTSGMAIGVRFSRGRFADWDTEPHVDVLYGNVTTGIPGGWIYIWEYTTSWSLLGSGLDGLPYFEKGDRIRVSAKGDKIRVYVNGELKNTVTANLTTGGFIGVGSWDDYSGLASVRAGVFYEDALTPYRITQAEFTHPNLMQLTVVEEDLTVYAQTAPGVGSNPPPQTIPSVSQTVAFFMDTSIMGRSVDNDIGFYFAGAPSFGTGWPGAGLYKSDDGGSSYSVIESFPLIEATVGAAENTLTYEGDIP